ncbi:MAG: CPBP family intramembrane glutamic endopeptidase, partial [Micropepsaceae bacterium]
SRLSAEGKSAVAMIGFSLFMAPFVYWILFRGQADVLTKLGFRDVSDDAVRAWVAGLLLAAAYVAYCVRIPSVRLWLVRVHPLKLLALILAVLAGTLEEIFFRKIVMDWMERLGGDTAVQVAVSSVSFGLMHAVWGGLRGSWTTAIGSVVATTLLGLGLAIVYLLGGRNLAPCIVSHFLVTALIEPGLVIAAFGGRMRA